MSTENANKLYLSLRFPLLLLAALWSIHLLILYVDFDYQYWALYPRRSFGSFGIFGIIGIFSSPFLHSGFEHLISNSFPILILSTTIIYFYPKVAFRSMLMIYIFTGIMVWLLGDYFFCEAKAGYDCIRGHVGISGVVYGMVTFVLGNGIFRKNRKSIILALIVLFFYSGIFLGILPTQEGISWESHLFGAIVGFFTSYFYREEIEADEVKPEDIYRNELPRSYRPYFLPPNTFDKTKAQRAAEAAAEANNPWNSTNTWDDIN
ncbi:MAG: rhomboid family intramembrane serine protease [Saprospiraceae bacterium]